MFPRTFRRTRGGHSESLVSAHKDLSPLPFFHYLPLFGKLIVSYPYRRQQPTTAAILEQILSVTTTTSSMKSAEERELMLGRLIGVSALALSGRLGKDKDSAAGALKVMRGSVECGALPKGTNIFLVFSNRLTFLTFSRPR